MHKHVDTLMLFLQFGCLNTNRWSEWVTSWCILMREKVNEWACVCEWLNEYLCLFIRNAIVFDVVGLFFKHATLMRTFDSKIFSYSEFDLRWNTKKKCAKAYELQYKRKLTACFFVLLWLQIYVIYILWSHMRDF